MHDIYFPLTCFVFFLMFIVNMMFFCKNAITKN